MATSSQAGDSPAVGEQSKVGVGVEIRQRRPLALDGLCATSGFNYRDSSCDGSGTEGVAGTTRDAGLWIADQLERLTSKDQAPERPELTR